MIRSSIALGLLACLLTAAPAVAQQQNSHFDQDALEEILERPQVPLDELPDVYYDYHVFQHETGNTVYARNAFYQKIGDGDGELGRKRALLAELLNRRLMGDIQIGDTLIIPTEWELDMRAYSPFPRYYPGARNFKKLFIIHKSVQAFAAYEHGELVRWGVVNTGSKESRTPTGRYNFNWQEPHRVSSLSPPGEPWDMYWVMNIHLERGIHFHQYAMPTGGPTSHGCIRALDADARWVYHWADTWKTTGGNGFASIGTRILEPGTTVLVLGEDPEDRPRPFTFRRRYPILERVELPPSPYDVPPGTPQQQRWDRQRLQAAR